MIRRSTRLAIGAALIVFAAQAQAQSTTNQQETTGKTTIIVPIALEQEGDLDFGIIIRPRDGSANVEISPEGDWAGDANRLGAEGGAPVYTVSGDSDRKYSVEVLETFSMTNDANDELVVTLLRPTDLRTLTGGTDQFGIGGKFTVLSTTPPGAYTGDFTVTVNYE